MTRLHDHQRYLPIALVSPVRPCIVSHSYMLLPLVDTGLLSGSAVFFLVPLLTTCMYSVTGSTTGISPPGLGLGLGYNKCPPLEQSRRLNHQIISRPGAHTYVCTCSYPCAGGTHCGLRSWSFSLQQPVGLYLRFGFDVEDESPSECNVRAPGTPPLSGRCGGRARGVVLVFWLVGWLPRE